MGSKRPQQIHKDKLSTDYKPRVKDEHIHEEDKQALHDTRGKLDQPDRGENPALTDLKARRAAKAEQAEQAEQGEDSE